MSLVFESTGPGPGTHALVIGVGHYPHLGPNAQLSELTGLSHLSSPPYSALAFAQHLIKDAESPDTDLKKPLRSVRLLLSPQPGREPELPAGWAPERATHRGIHLAAAAWLMQATSPEDTLIFYFSGHGLRSDPVMLPEDFGDPIFPAMQNGISATASQLAVANQPPREQLWLMDCCRDLQMISLQDKATGIGNAQLTPENHGNLQRFGLMASNAFSQAFGPPDAPSYFCEAVLAALRGGGARRSGGRWLIRAGSLLESVNEHLNQRSLDGRQTATPVGGGGNFVLYDRSDPPQVPVYVQATPRTNARKVDLELERGGDTHPVSADPRAGVWTTALAPGEWRLSARPREPGGPPEQTLDEMVYPPLATWTLTW